MPESALDLVFYYLFGVINCVIELMDSGQAVYLFSNVFYCAGFVFVGGLAHKIHCVGGGLFGMEEESALFRATGTVR